MQTNIPQAFWKPVALWMMIIFASMIVDLWKMELKEMWLDS